MKASKAIEILKLECTTQKLQSDPDYLASARLGIEALKRCQYIAEHTERWADVLLPGETPENEK